MEVFSFSFQMFSFLIFGDLNPVLLFALKCYIQPVLIMFCYYLTSFSLFIFLPPYHTAFHVSVKKLFLLCVDVLQLIPYASSKTVFKICLFGSFFVLFFFYH
uniref:Uncharacterized protein n=1 Tax=Anguilla anguilla TaxID=7936 RepID=A0A0E9QMD7_ANGAN